VDLSEYKFDEEMSLCIEEGGDDFDSLFKQGMLRALTGRTVGKDTAFKVSCDAIGVETAEELEVVWKNATDNPSGKGHDIYDEDVFIRAKRYAMMTTKSEVICPRHFNVAFMAEVKESKYICKDCQLS